MEGREEDKCLLVGDEDLERGNEVSKRDAPVAEPLLEVFGIVDEDDEVVLLALVVDLGLGSFAASHFV